MNKLATLDLILASTVVGSCLLFFLSTLVLRLTLDRRVRKYALPADNQLANMAEKERVFTNQLFSVLEEWNALLRGIFSSNSLAIR